jgi:ABC-type amino acid transport substrate-binding protein
MRSSFSSAVGAAMAAVMLVLTSPNLKAADPGMEQLVVGTAANYPPVVFRQDDAIVGIEADFAEALGQELSLDVTFVDMSWEHLLEALDNDRIDVIMAGMSVTEYRKEKVAFTQPYMEVGQMALIRSADLGRLSAPGAMAVAGRVIGVQDETTGEQFVRTAYADASLMVFASPEDGVAALRRGDIEFFVHDAPTIWTLTLGVDVLAEPDVMALYTPLTRENLAWAVKKGNVQLLEALNTALQTMQEDGRAQHIIDSWIKGTVTVSSPLPPVEF